MFKNRGKIPYIISALLFTILIGNLNGKTKEKPAMTISVFPFIDGIEDRKLTKLIETKFIQHLERLKNDPDSYKIVLFNDYGIENINQELTQIISEYETTGLMNRSYLNSLMNKLPSRPEKIVFGKTYDYQLSPYFGYWHKTGLFICLIDTENFEIEKEFFSSYYIDRGKVTKSVERMVKNIFRKNKIRNLKETYYNLKTTNNINSFAELDRLFAEDPPRKLSPGVKIASNLTEFTTIEGRMLNICENSRMFVHSPLYPVALNLRSDSNLTTQGEKIFFLFTFGAGIGYFSHNTDLYFEYLSGDIINLTLAKISPFSSVSSSFFYLSPRKKDEFKFTNDYGVGLRYEKAITTGKYLWRVSIGYVKQQGYRLDNYSNIEVDGEQYAGQTYEYGDQYYLGAGIKYKTPHAQISLGTNYVFLAPVLIDEKLISSTRKEKLFLVPTLTLADFIIITGGVNLNNINETFVGFNIKL